jgi:hypothetical protein
LLGEALESYRVVEELLQSRSDVKSLCPSAVDEKLVDLLKALAGKKEDVGLLIRELDTDEIKKKQQNYHFVEQKLRDHVRDVQKATADRIIAMFGTKLHKFQRFWEER